MRLFFKLLLFLFLIGIPQETHSASNKRDLIISIDNHIPPSGWDPNEELIKKNIKEFIKIVRPKRVTVFAVGHDGFSQYPSKIFPKQMPSKRYPGVTTNNIDMLKIWANELKSNEIEFFVYISTLRNDALIDLKPNYLRKFSNKSNTNIIDHNSGYLNEILLPGLDEIIKKYNPGGFFFDGDYWTIIDSWHPSTITLYEKTTKKMHPQDFSSEDFSSYRNFTYESYASNYLEKINSFFESKSKDYNWTVNGAFSFRDPQSIPSSLGRINIDLPPFFGLQEAYIETNFANNQNKPFELIFPRFVQAEGNFRYQNKNKIMILQELALSHSFGADVHLYLPMKRGGIIQSSDINPFIKIFDEFHEVFGQNKKSNNHESLSKVLILNQAKNAINTRNFTNLRNIASNLLEKNIQFDIISDTTLKDNKKLREKYFKKATHIIVPMPIEKSDKIWVKELLKAGRKILIYQDYLFNLKKKNDPLKSRVSKESIFPNRKYCFFEIDDNFKSNEIVCKNNENINEVGTLAKNKYSNGEIWQLYMGDKIAFNQKSFLFYQKNILEYFLKDLDEEISFPDSFPNGIIIRSTKNKNNAFKISILNISHGGRKLLRHTNYEKIPKVAELKLRFKNPVRCKQTTTEGNIYSSGEEIITKPFNIYSTLDCYYEI